MCFECNFIRFVNHKSMMDLFKFISHSTMSWFINEWMNQQQINALKYFMLKFKQINQ